MGARIKQLDEQNQGFTLINYNLEEDYVKRGSKLDETAGELMALRLHETNLNK